MTLLVLGILLFALIHLSKSLAPDFRISLQQRLGENPYKGVFSLFIITSIVLIVLGWRSTVPQYIYVPSPALRMPALLLLVIAFWLLVISSRPSRIKRVLRHPQLTGVALWGIAHLLLNGDSRGLVLFGGLTLWAIVEVFTINHRDGPWIKPAPPSLSVDAINLVITAVVLAVVIVAHPWLAGVAVTGHLPL
ncbi:MAG: NnrU family protein [Pseudomonadota bacterium]